MSVRESPYTSARVTCEGCDEERERLLASVYRAGQTVPLYCGRCRADTDHSVDEVGL